MTEMTQIEGGCQCGAVKYILSGPLHSCSLCHCSPCRKAAGAPLVSWARIDRDALNLTGNSVRQFESSPGVRRSFCDQCGTTLFYETDTMGPFVDVTTESLDDPDRILPGAQIWCQYARAYMSNLDDIPRFESVPHRQ